MARVQECACGCWKTAKKGRKFIYYDTPGIAQVHTVGWCGRFARYPFPKAHWYPEEGHQTPTVLYAPIR